jgi:hypothetical protein
MSLSPLLPFLLFLFFLSFLHSIINHNVAYIAFSTAYPFVVKVFLPSPACPPLLFSLLPLLCSASLLCLLFSVHKLKYLICRCRRSAIGPRQPSSALVPLVMMADEDVSRLQADLLTVKEQLYATRERESTAVTACRNLEEGRLTDRQKLQARVFF